MGNGIVVTTFIIAVFFISAIGLFLLLSEDKKKKFLDWSNKF